MKEKNTLALPILLLAAFFFSLSGVFNRMIGQEAGAFTGLCARTIISGVFFGLFLLFTKEKINFNNFSRKDICLFLFRSFLTIIDFLTFFYAINQMPLGITLLIFYTSYMTVSFMYSIISPKEKVKITDGIALILAIFGIGLIYNFDIGNIELLPFLAAIITGMTYSLNTALSKPLTSKFSVTFTNFITYAVTGFISIPLFFIAYSTGLEKIDLPLSTTAIAGISLIGFNTFLTFSLLIYGYKLVNVNRASLILLSEIIFTSIVGFIIYKENITVNLIAGAGLIIIALALPYLKSYNKS